MPKTKLTDDQIYALQQWAHRHGRYWKADLRQAWMTGNYGEFEMSNYLQQVRNSFGPSWLINYRLPKFLEVYR